MDLIKLLEQEVQILVNKMDNQSNPAYLDYKEGSYGFTQNACAQNQNENNMKEENIKPVTLIALCGESAAGKTTLINRLIEKNKNISVISADHYYKDISDLIERFGSFTCLVESGYDAESASAFQMLRLVRDIKTLKQGHGIWMPFYDMTNGRSVPEAKWFEPQKTVIIEGICTFYEPIRDLFDFKIYLQADKERQKRRYFERAIERGQNPDEVKKQFKLVCQAALKNIIPNQKYADLVVKLKPEEKDQKRRELITGALSAGIDTGSTIKGAQDDNDTKEENHHSRSCTERAISLQKDLPKTEAKINIAKPNFTSVYDPALWAYYLGRSNEKQ